MIDIEEEYRTNKRALISVAYNILKNADVAEDAVHAAVLKAWRLREKYNPARCPPLSWLCVITKSVAIDMERKRRSSMRVAKEYAQHRTESAEDSLLEQLCLKQLREKLQPTLTSLSPLRLHLLYLRFVREYSDSQIAAYMCIPLGTVKSGIRKALAELRTKKADLVY